jgi:biopolymer transport protein ExbD
MSRKRRELLTPDLTPLIDVVFLLLIFFLVSSVFKKEELALLLQLPKAEQGASDAQQDNKSITVELSKDKVAINAKEYPIREVESVLKKFSKKSLVNLRVDGTVEYKRLVKVLDTLRKLQLENVNLITEQE